MSILLNTYGLCTHIKSPIDGTDNNSNGFTDHSKGGQDIKAIGVEEALYGLCQLQTVSSIPQHSVASRASSRASTIFWQA